MQNILKFIAAVVALGVAFQAIAKPELLIDDTRYTGPQLDLTGYNKGSYNFTMGPIFLPGGITFTAKPGDGGNTGLGSIVGQGGHGLSDNGAIGGPATYIGIDSATGYAKLEFATAVSSFGGYWNYSQGYNSDDGYFLNPDNDSPTLSAFRADDTLIASYDLFTAAPINTPGAFNQFAFRGIVDDTADIKYLQFGGSYIVLAGTADGSLIAAPIPEPETYAMLLAGLGMLALITRRRKLA
jgi:hypothetical protein